jgi:hypothetical protein
MSGPSSDSPAVAAGEGDRLLPPAPPRAPARPSTRHLPCSWFRVSLAVAALAALGAAGGLLTWTLRHHRYSTSQLSELEGTIRSIQGELKSEKTRSFNMQTDLENLHSFMNNISDTSNIGIYNQMLKIKNELMQDMNSTLTTVRQELASGEGAAAAAAAASARGVQRVRGNVSHMAAEMAESMNRWVLPVPIAHPIPSYAMLSYAL